jgi:excisionase family DNA binding protein
MMQDDFLTVAEIAKTLRVNPQTVRNWIDRGELPAVRVGARRVRVRQSQLDDFLAAGEIGTPPEGDSWQPVRDALAAAAAAVDGRNRARLDEAISELADAARGLPGE